MVLVRDFEQDRRFLADRKDGYVTDEVFLKYADKGWPAALQEIQRLKLQLLAAGVFAASQPHCPDGKDCDGNTSEQSCVACWLEHWQSGTFQNGNNHGTTSKKETVGEGAE